jgi:hypothetical protein
MPPATGNPGFFQAAHQKVGEMISAADVNW